MSTKPSDGGRLNTAGSLLILTWTSGIRCVLSVQKSGESNLKDKIPLARKSVSITNALPLLALWESRGDGLEEGRSDDNMIFIPITTAQTRFGGRNRVGAYHGACQEHRFS